MIGYWSTDLEEMDMRTDTQINNELAHSSPYLHEMSEEESRNLKRMLLIMLKDIASVCEKYELTYMLCGGSCLGAVRHNGFIPWDDDLDIIMPRSDYDRFAQLCLSGVLGPDYEMEAPNPKTDCKNTFMKVFRNGTLDEELFNENTPFHKGIFVDIFPLENASSKDLIRKIHSGLSALLKFISTSVLYVQYPSEGYHRFVSASRPALKRYRFRLVVGTLFGWIPHRRWVYWFDRFNQSKRETGFRSVSALDYYKEALPQEVFLPVRYSSFEGLSVPIPAQPDVYLTNLYGDYMQIPPEEKRGRHYVYKYRCPSV